MMRHDMADQLPPEYLGYLDSAVKMILDQGLAVIIDMHPDSDFKAKLAQQDDFVEQFTDFWRALAHHYSTYDPDMVSFEILNEPEFRDRYRWAGVQAKLANAIREGAPQHTIIAAGANWSDIPDLLSLTPLADQNVIYNFHYYEPHIFTHQGASWGVPFWINLRDVPYPLTPESVGKAAAEQRDALPKWELTEAGYGYWNRDRIAGEMRFAGDWAKAHHVPLTCNEFGVYRNHSDPDARARWIEDVRTSLEQNNIGWTMWDYRGGFGVVTHEPGTTVPDNRILHALGLK
jgi:aryl-phospho-beta-D-glucosidase BglC (GH1 family)